MISQRTKDALAALRAQGKKLGGIRPKTVKIVDAANARTEKLRPVFTELSHLSARGMYVPNCEPVRVPTPTGKPWSAVTVIKVQRRLEGGS